MYGYIYACGAEGYLSASFLARFLLVSKGKARRREKQEEEAGGESKQKGKARMEQKEGKSK